MAVRLNDQNKRELDIYTKNFILKAFQVIVQSRMGEIDRYTAKDNLTTDWFGLPIPDLPEVMFVARKSLVQPLLNQPINIEISLKKSNQNTYVCLEIWSISMDLNHLDPNIKVCSGVYSRMTTALKSILIATRVTTAYHIAKRQQGDNFQVHFWYFLGEANTSIFGFDIQHRQVTTVATPAGTIRVHLSYATNPNMCCSSKGSVAFDMKDDHFCLPRSTQLTQSKPCRKTFRSPQSVEDLHQLDAQEKSDCCTAVFSTSPQEGFCSTLLPRISEIILSSNEDVTRFDENSALFLQAERTITVEKPEDSPFAGLMSVLPSSDNCASEHVRSNKPVPSEGHISDSEDEGICHGSDEKGDTDSTDGISVDVPVSGDFVMLPPLEFPFHDADSSSNLGQFYKEMCSAQSLVLCQQHVVDFESYLADIKQQIDMFTESRPVFDSFIELISRRLRDDEAFD